MFYVMLYAFDCFIKTILESKLAFLATRAEKKKLMPENA